MKKQFTKILVSISLAIISLAFAQQEITTVAELERLAPLGGEYRLAAGTYELSEPLLLTKGLTLLGAGVGKTIVTGSQQFYVIRIESTEHFKLDGISFEYTGTGGTEILEIADASFEISNCSVKGAIYSEENDFFYGDGLYVYKNAQGKVNNCEFTKNEFNAIALEHGASLDVTDSKFRNNATAVAVFDNGKVTIKDSVFENNGSEDDSVIYANGDSELSIENNRFDGNLFGSFYFLGNAKVIVNGNTIKNSGEVYKAITAKENTELTLTENIISDNPKGALYLTGNCKVDMTANTFKNNGNKENYGMFFDGESQVNFNKNTSNSDYGFVVSGNAKFTAKENSFTASKFVALIGEKQAELILGKNAFEFNATLAFALRDNATAELVENTFRGNGNSDTSGGSADNRSIAAVDDSQLKLIKNIFSSDAGIITQGHSKVILKENQFKNCKYNTAVQVERNSKVEITKNTFNICPEASILVNGNASASVIDNTFIRSGSDTSMSIIVHESGQLTMSDNSLTGDWGLLFDENAKATVTNNVIEKAELKDFAHINVLGDVIVEIVNNQISTPISEAIIIYGNAEATISNNTIKGISTSVTSSTTGLLVANSAKVTVNDNTFSDLDIGIDIKGTADLTMRNNTFNNNKKDIQQ